MTVNGLYRMLDKIKPEIKSEIREKLHNGLEPHSHGQRVS